MSDLMPLADALVDAEVFTDGDWVESKDQDPDGDVRLTQLADVGDGEWINKSARFLTSEKAKQLRCTYLKPGDLLLARMPDPLGRCCVFPGDPMPCVTVVDVCVIRPNQQKVDNRYLMRVINAPYGRHGIAKHITGTTRQRISRRNLGKIQIPLPPLAEQKRIAAILDAADALRAKRRESLAQLDTLLQSTFLDMFGDPVTNPKGWERKPLKHGVESFEGGRNVKPTDAERSDGVRVLKVSAVTSGEYRPEESKPFSDDEKVPTSHIVRKGDLLISRANTSALVGAVCHVWDTGAREMLPDKLWRFVWVEPRRIEPLFMLHVARSGYFREQLIQRATGTSGSMKNIGKNKMLEIPIPYPPIDLQRRFDALVESVEQQKASQRAHLAELDTLFASLQSRAFRGEL